MKHITYAESSWLLGDDAADALIEYAVLLARRESADSVRVAVLDLDGHEQSVTFLIGPATMMTAESTASRLDEPDNAAAIVEIHKRMALITSPPNARPYNPSEFEGFDSSPLD